MARGRIDGAKNLQVFARGKRYGSAGVGDNGSACLHGQVAQSLRTQCAGGCKRQADRITEQFVQHAKAAESCDIAAGGPDQIAGIQNPVLHLRTDLRTVGNPQVIYTGQAVRGESPLPEGNRIDPEFPRVS